ncbi:uncharacterized protein LOC143767023 [Ranitomeya variabilis]|uniref:uncharacterized protein LOC143767023 n=1 Tax=Ranitomeya variabilis TaxID=490064 RepID=UPI004055C5A1
MPGAQSSLALRSPALDYLNMKRKSEMSCILDFMYSLSKGGDKPDERYLVSRNIIEHFFMPRSLGIKIPLNNPEACEETGEPGGNPPVLGGKCRIVREAAAAAAACLRFFLLSRSLRSPWLLGPPPKKQAKPTKVVAHGGHKRKKVPRRLSSPQLPVSKSASQKKKRIVVDEEPLTIHNETLINLVEANPSIWDQSDSSHHDIVKNRKLWDQIISHFDPRYMEKSSTSKKKIADAVHTRWKSIRDRFVRDYRNSQNVPSGAGAKRVTPYVHYEKLLFLQKTLSQRS